MLLWKALQHRPTRSLWLGQLLSSVGDQIHHVAFIWLAVQEIGNDTGYLSSAQAISTLIFGLAGHRLVAHLSSEQAMIRLDLIRAALVSLPVLFYLFGLPTFLVLTVCSVLVSGLQALFEPSFMQTIPRVAPQPELRMAVNGLMSTTFRLARFIGPAFVGLLSPWVPMIHFFLIDALTYLGSAGSIRSLKLQPKPPAPSPAFHWAEFWVELKSSYRLLQTAPSVWRTLLAKSITGGAWWLPSSPVYS
jgi:predicted MFS family arabinose efflux permease